MRLMLMLVMLGAGPAAAQFRGTVHGEGWRPTVPPASSGSPRIGTGREVADIRNRIDDGRASSQLTRRDARRFRREAGQLGDLADRYESGGLSAAEARELDTRAVVLRAQVDARRAGSPEGEAHRGR